MAPSSACVNPLNLWCGLSRDATVSSRIDFSSNYDCHYSYDLSWKVFHARHLAWKICVAAYVRMELDSNSVLTPMRSCMDNKTPYQSFAGLQNYLLTYDSSNLIYLLINPIKNIY